MKKTDIEPQSVTVAGERSRTVVGERSRTEPYELPAGWKWTRLGDVAEIARGGSPRPIEKYITTADDGINWIKIGDAEKDGKYIFSTKEKIIKEGLSKTRYVEEGDFLLTNSMSFGRPYILKTSGCIHDGWLVIKKCTAYNQDFLYYLLSSTFVFNQFSLLAKGSTVKNLKSETVRQVVLPLPTLAEQERIVSRIESLFTKLDEAKDRAQSVVDGFEKRKAAILHKAFTGELTANWRKENGVPDDSWEEKKLGDLCSEIRIGPFGSLLHEEDYIANAIPLVNPKHISDQRIIPDDKITVSLEKADELRAYKLKKNDIILGRRGEMGRCAPVGEKEGGWLCGTGSMILRLKPEYLATVYSIFISSYKSVLYFEENAVGSTLKNLNEKIVRNLPLPNMSLPEQQEIVRILDSVLEKESRAKEAAGAVLDQIDLLKKSILARAFRGKL